MLRIIDIVEQFEYLGTKVKQNSAIVLSNILKSKKIYLLIRKQILIRHLVQVSKKLNTNGGQGWIRTIVLK